MSLCVLLQACQGMEPASQASLAAALQALPSKHTLIVTGESLKVQSGTKDPQTQALMLCIAWPSFNLAGLKAEEKVFEFHSHRLCSRADLQGTV